MPVTGALDLEVLAERGNLDVDSLAELNPALTRRLTPAYGSYQLAVPCGREEQVAEVIASIFANFRLFLIVLARVVALFESAPLFSSEAVPQPAKVTRLEDLAPVIELYHHTVRAGQYDEAFTLFRDRLSQATYYQLGAYQLIIDLMRVLFPDGEDHPPRLKDESDQGCRGQDGADQHHQQGPRRCAPIHPHHQQTKADQQQQWRHFIRRRTDPKQPIKRHPRSKRPDPVSDRRVGRQHIVGDIPRIKLEAKLTPVLLKAHQKLDQARLLFEEAGEEDQRRQNAGEDRTIDEKA